MFLLYVIKQFIMKSLYDTLGLEQLSEPMNLIEVSEQGHLVPVLGCLELGENPNLQDPEDGTSALIMSSVNGHEKIVETLIMHGATIDLQNNKGETALMAAASFGHIEVVKMLLKAGADPAKENKRGNTPFGLAAWNNHPLILIEFIKNGINIELMNEDGFTSLHLASYNHSYESMKILLEYRADPTLANTDGIIPLDYPHSQTLWKRFLDYYKTDSRFK